MKKIYLFFTFFFLYATFAQNSKISNSGLENIDEEIKKSKAYAASDPITATKKLQQLKEQCEKIHYTNGAMTSSMGLVLLYYNAGNYKKTIEESRFVEKYAKNLQAFDYVSDIYRMRSNAYREMGLIDECLAELKKSLINVEDIKAPNRRFYRKSLIYESYAGIYESKGDSKKHIFYRHRSIVSSYQMPENNPETINAKYQNLAYQFASLGLAYSNLKVNDSARYYFKKALKIHESDKYDIYVNGRATLLSDMAKFYNDNGEYHHAILFAKKAERFEKQTPMPYIRKDIYHTLFSSYVETHKQDSSRYYSKLYVSLSDSLLKSEKESMITPVKQIISDKEHENKTTIKNILIISALILFAAILMGWLFWRRKNRIIHGKYKDLIAKISEQQNEQKLELKNNVGNNQTKASITITDETIKALLLKLEKFENSKKYLRKDVNLTWLANNLSTNTKYLSEVIKVYRNHNFTSYINELRINYIIRKLYENPVYREYKITYLAEECGYATPRVFVNAFKQQTGFTPSYFVEQLKASE
ncbi:helix-turn-helix domain-containing protein [Chryseobacterium gallinarum]|uniref:Helix-turn-helix transcriptional regulator n=1 Tax=Chryseobacterium gallinarum TaxID=1324352 RepID=A0ABX6KLH8_CHRGL|nr:AraC family transcriptional regulator [Chryseobacterium gallinarum]QIY89497.1 helix-turn-helix transcriptional regulator [Chryseobacterium gallinarum]